MNLRLAALAVRRVAPWWVALALALVGVLAASSAASSLPAASALARQGVWSVLALLATLTFVPRAAGLAARFSSLEFGWVGAQPLSRARWFATCLAGSLAAALAVCALAATLAESAARFDGASLREVGLAAVPERGVLDGRESVRWSVDAEAGETLRVELSCVNIEPTAEVEWRARRGGEQRRVRATISRPQALELAIPAGVGPVELELERTSGGALVVLSGERLQRLAPCGSSRSASLALACHALLAWSALMALALGLAPWIGTRLAGALALVVPLAAWLAGDEFAVDVSPTGALVRALEVAGRGLVPALPSLAEVACAAACSAVGGVLFVRGLGRERGREREGA
ncbi:MAG: hypothetical protein FJ298_01075 [Planctomycetes bacterium]|nr:hypothetical protein [Planctomycetota bacterium]